jgi:hypothetical protein
MKISSLILCFPSTLQGWFRSILYFPSPSPSPLEEGGSAPRRMPAVRYCRRLLGRSCAEERPRTTRSKEARQCRTASTTRGFVALGGESLGGGWSSAGGIASLQRALVRSPKLRALPRYPLLLMQEAAPLWMLLLPGRYHCIFLRSGR